ncbi:hypothetical protein BJ322DRAFT_1076731 [Thelephora terrestris]|uniref:F-box domain-containing protein n=1 Tax=Thelephora terrestris TaxID=56493 RepID=A0A9P6HB28_9AGAM|nr:hypothetical protein BJ322DRAFT_1076731 [Thelephora terrestris]
MTTFNDLLLKLLPSIVQNVAQPESLASLCLINKIFCKFTQPFLYHTITVTPWHHKEKAIKIFRMLSSSPELAKHVRKLEIRYFPKGLDGICLDNLINSCLQGLKNCVNLLSCTWTRDGSLSSSILLAILKHSSLQELEIHGCHNKNYDHTILPRFTSVLPLWLKSLVRPLQSLSIMCERSLAVTDELLGRISESLSGLDELELAGCHLVTHEALASAICHNKNGIKSLSIKKVSLSLNLLEFDRRCRSAQLLRHLISLTITIEHVPLKLTWMKDIPLLVSSSPLEHLQLHAIAVLMDTRADDLVAALISTHGPHLKRLSLHRMTISLGVLDKACTGFTNLEQLFVFVRQEDLELIANALSKVSKLQAVHINLPILRPNGSYCYDSYFSAQDVLCIVNKCSPTLTQIGCANHVWQASSVQNIIFFGEFHGKTG